MCVVCVYIYQCIFVVLDIVLLALEICGSCYSWCKASLIWKRQ